MKSACASGSAHMTPRTPGSGIHDWLIGPQCCPKTFCSLFPEAIQTTRTRFESFKVIILFWGESTCIIERKTQNVSNKEPARSIYSMQ